MKDSSLDFPVVGGKYTTNWEYSKKIPVGSKLTLIPEPENEFDSGAVKVYDGEKHIGYIPNRGQSCLMCHTSVPKGDTKCPNCKATGEYIQPGGLAFRIANQKILEKLYVCFVIETNPDGSDIAITKCRLMWTESAPYTIGEDKK